MRETMGRKVFVSKVRVDHSNATCPTCRRKVEKVTDDFRTNTLLDIYLKMHPSKTRSQDEIEELDAAYKRGDTVLPHRHD